MIINVKKVTTIPNSRDEFNIYSYSAQAESLTDIKKKGFFNQTYNFAKSGEIIRVFKHDEDMKLTALLEFLVTSVDVKNQVVDGQFINEVILDKKAVSKKEAAATLEEVIREQVESVLESEDLKSIVAKIVKDLAIKAAAKNLEDNA